MYLELGPPVMLDAAALKTMKISQIWKGRFGFVYKRTECTEVEPKLDSARWQAFSSVSELYLVLHGVSDRAELVSIETFVHLGVG